jgi:hypothetical protein
MTTRASKSTQKQDVLTPTYLFDERWPQTWSTKCEALGLLWGTETATVSIQADKLAKAATRVNNLLTTRNASRTTMLEAIGSLCHVASCFPPARAVLQCLQEASPSTADTRYRHAVLMIFAGSLQSYKIPSGSTRSRSSTSQTSRIHIITCSWTPAETACALWSLL